MKYIIGIGNYSMYDDSLGIRLIEYLEENNLVDGFKAIDLSGNALNIFSYLSESTDKIIIVDSAGLDMEPGEYKFFSHEKVKSLKALSGITTHEGDMVKVLELAGATGYHIPEIIFMGVEPEEIKREVGLSEILESRLPEYGQVLLREIML